MDVPKKILIARFPLESAWGGEEEIHLVMAEIFRKHAIQTELLSSCPYLSERFQKEGFFVKEEFQKDITSDWRIFRNIFTLLCFFIRGLYWIPYFRYIRKVRTVLFLTLIEKLLWTPLAKLLGMRVYWGHHAPLGTWLSKNPYLFLWKFWSQHVQIIVASGFMKKELSVFTNYPENILILPNTLSPKKDMSEVTISSGSDFHKLLNMRAKIDREKEDLFLVGTASRLSPEKGMRDVIAAAENLKSKNILFLCAGSGSEEKALLKEIKAKGLRKVHLIGFLNPDEMRIFLQHIDLFVLPSHEEPFGLVLLEAMSTQKAIAASYVGGIPEVLGAKNEGLFEVKNPDDLVQKILFFEKNEALRKELGQRNFAHFKKNYSGAEFEKKLLNIFKMESPSAIRETLI